MLFRGLLKLTWLELKIFVREPLGAIGTVLIPVVMFVVLGRSFGRRAAAAPASSLLSLDVPVFTTLLIVLSAVLSLVTIISIYREGGILKRLRATPLRPYTILSAHVVVKLLLSVMTLALVVLAGKRYYPANLDVPVLGFTLALLLSTLSILSVGFVIASVVPTARFAQPIGAAILYPMVAVSGLFVPLDAMPAPLKLVARVLPITYAVSLMRGILANQPWSAHVGDVVGLLVVFVICTALAAKIFRWE